MAAISGEALLLKLQSVLPEAKFSLQAVEAVVDMYQGSSLLIPNKQTTGGMNKVVREAQMEFSRPMRAELVILQILMCTWNMQPNPPSATELSGRYNLSVEEVQLDDSFPLYVWYMKFALGLVSAKEHIEFIIQDVVIPLSEGVNKKRYVAGGGSETSETTRRYFVFELESGCYRPKTLRMMAGGVQSTNQTTEESSASEPADPGARFAEYYATPTQSHRDTVGSSSTGFPEGFADVLGLLLSPNTTSSHQDSQSSRESRESQQHPNQQDQQDRQDGDHEVARAEAEEVIVGHKRKRVVAEAGLPCAQGAEVTAEQSPVGL